MPIDAELRKDRERDGHPDCVPDGGPLRHSDEADFADVLLGLHTELCTLHEVAAQPIEASHEALTAALERWKAGAAFPLTDVLLAFGGVVSVVDHLWRVMEEIRGELARIDAEVPHLPGPGVG